MQSRHFLALGLLLLGLEAGAATVSKTKAQTMAQSFFTATKAGTGSLTLVWTGPEDAATKASDNFDAPYYVFNNSGGGFVIIAGDDIVTPVLGYSDRGSFVVDGMPDNVTEWFRSLKTCINTGRAEGGKALSSTIQAWKYPSFGNPSKYLATPPWGQEDPFNRKCPKVGANETVTGCVATAMAEILRIFQSPASLIGEIPAYTTLTKKISISAHSSSGSYSWEKMPATSPLEDPWSTTNATAVSTLMYDCGTSVKMDYNVSSEGGSSAYTEDVPLALRKYFGIDESVSLEVCEHYLQSEWTDMLKKNIDDGSPLLYAGYSKNAGGHAFVIDGYDTQGKFHINWGWYGTDNGYFAFPDFIVEDYSFTYRNQAVTNIKPDHGGAAEMSLSFDRYNVADMGLIPSTYDIKANVSFDIYGEGMLYNSTYALDNYKPVIAVARYDKNGNFKEMISQEIQIEGTLVPGSGYVDFVVEKCKCTSISEGDVAVIVHKPQGGTGWTVVKSRKGDPTFASTLNLSSKLTPDDISLGSSFKYDKQTKTLEINTLKGASGNVISDTDALELKEGIIIEDGKITLDCAGLESGTYWVLLSKDGRTFSFSVEL